MVDWSNNGCCRVSKVSSLCFVILHFKPKRTYPLCESLYYGFGSWYWVRKCNLTLETWGREGGLGLKFKSILVLTIHNLIKMDLEVERVESVLKENKRRRESVIELYLQKAEQWVRDGKYERRENEIQTVRLRQKKLMCTTHVKKG